MFKQFIFISVFSFSVVGAKEAAIPTEEIKNFVDVYNVIRREYVEEVSPEMLIDNAIEGMLSGLDPHSAYLKKSKAEDFYRDTNGQFSGIGIEIEIVNGQLKVIAPIADSPAEKAGILANDTIIKINDKLVDELPMHEVVKLLRGEPGEIIDFVVQREGGGTENITVVRDLINIPSISDKVLSPGYAVIRITQFQENTANEFSQALNKLNANDLKGLIIDLRNNPGGYIDEATGVADLFLSSGLIVSTKNNNTGEEERIRANLKSDAVKTPLVVLINRGSASASELLAATLQDHQRAVIVGQKSFGKGSVQDIVPLSNGDAVKLTIAQYYTPNGNAIQAKGVVPDIEIASLSIKEDKINLLSYSEKDIIGHLPNPNQSSASETVKEPLTDVGNNEILALAKQDFQLYEALNILKTLTFREQL